MTSEWYDRSLPTNPTTAVFGSLLPALPYVYLHAYVLPIRIIYVYSMRILFMYVSQPYELGCLKALLCRALYFLRLCVFSSFTLQRASRFHSGCIHISMHAGICTNVSLYIHSTREYSFCDPAHRFARACAPLGTLGSSAGFELTRCVCASGKSVRCHTLNRSDGVARMGFVQRSVTLPRFSHYTRVR